eukprot:g7400.t1
MEVIRVKASAAMSWIDSTTSAPPDRAEELEKFGASRGASRGLAAWEARQLGAYAGWYEYEGQRTPLAPPRGGGVDPDGGFARAFSDCGAFLLLAAADIGTSSSAANASAEDLGATLQSNATPQLQGLRRNNTRAKYGLADCGDDLSAIQPTKTDATAKTLAASLLCVPNLFGGTSLAELVSS